MERRGQVRFAGEFEQIGGVQLFDVVRRSNADGKAALKGNDAGELPAVQDYAFEAIKLRNGEVPDVVEDEAIPRIVSREPVGGVEIEWVQSTFEAGSIVHGLAPGVGSLKLQALGEVFLQKDLQGVVVRTGDRVFGEDTGKDG